LMVAQSASKNRPYLRDRESACSLFGQMGGFLDFFGFE